MTKNRILGIDLGDARTGFAVSDPTGLLASAVGTLHESDMQILAQKAAGYAKEYSCEKIVLGYPKNMNNTVGERAKKTEAFKELLAGYVPGIEIILWDERQTTKFAVGILNETNTRGKKRKNIVDTVAATIILQGYLDSLR